MTSMGFCRQGWWVCAPSWLIPTREPPAQGRGEASAWPPGADQSLRSGGPASGASCWRCVFTVRVCVCSADRPASELVCVGAGAVAVVGGAGRG